MFEFLLACCRFPLLFLHWLISAAHASLHFYERSCEEEGTSASGRLHHIGSDTYGANVSVAVIGVS